MAPRGSYTAPTLVFLVGECTCQQPMSSTSASSSTASPKYAALQTPSTTPAPGGVRVECPWADNTTYTVPQTNQVFLRQCRYNWVASHSGLDLQNFPATSMEECLGLCAKLNAKVHVTGTICIGVTWVFEAPQGIFPNYCWLKGRLGSVTYFSDMESAVLLL